MYDSLLALLILSMILTTSVSKTCVTEKIVVVFTSLVLNSSSSGL